MYYRRSSILLASLVISYLNLEKLLPISNMFLISSANSLSSSLNFYKLWQFFVKMPWISLQTKMGFILPIKIYHREQSFRFEQANIPSKQPLSSSSMNFTRFYSQTTSMGGVTFMGKLWLSFASNILSEFEQSLVNGEEIQSLIILEMTLPSKYSGNPYLLHPLCCFFFFTNLGRFT